MEHITYALFDDEAHARAALGAIEASGTDRRHCSAVLHRGRLDDGQLGILESAAPEGLREGAAIGGIGGALLGGVLFGPAGLVSIGATALVASLYGAIAGAIAGSGLPDRRLEQLSKQLAGGKVLLVVEAPSLQCRDEADAAARANGGQVQHKPFL